jgi:hypothetical protein
MISAIGAGAIMILPFCHNVGIFEYVISPSNKTKENEMNEAEERRRKENVEGASLSAKLKLRQHPTSRDHFPSILFFAPPLLLHFLFIYIDIGTASRTTHSLYSDLERRNAG